jgi:hypothetical protein
LDQLDNEADKKTSKSPSSSSLQDITSIATKMASAAFKHIDRSSNSQRQSTIDIWIMQPMKGKRGDMLATCYANVEKGRIKDFFRETTKES